MASFDTLIRGGTVVDGTGAPPQTADIAILDGRIAAIGQGLGTARRMVDADGLLVTPGWVDIHTHYDGQASWDPVLLPSLRHGVTTAVMGNCGVGFAPARPSQRPWLIGLMEGVEDIPGASLEAGMHWDWESFPQYLDALDATPRAFDLASMLAHGALRAYVMGERGAANENATADDLAQMARITGEAMRGGAVGLSSSRTPIHIAADGRPVPGTFAAEDELLALARAVKASGHGLVEMVNTGIVGEDCAGLDRDMALMRSLAAKSGATLMFLLLQHNIDPAQWQRQLAVCEAAARDGHRLIPQVSGRPISILFSFEGEHPWRFMPSYQALRDLPFEQRYAALATPEVRARLLADVDPNDTGFSLMYKNPVMWEHTYAAGSPIDYTPPRERCIAEMARAEGRTPREVAYDLLLAKHGRAILTHFGVNYAEGNADALHSMLRHPLSALGLSDAGAHVRFIADAGMHSYMLTRWVRDTDRSSPHHLAVEYVVKKLSGANAELFGFHDRGRLLPSLRADLNLIDLESLATAAPTMVYDLPADMPRLTEKVTGYVATCVNGSFVMEGGEDTGARPGRILRGGARAA